MTPQEQYGGILWALFCWFFLHLKTWSPYTSIVLDLVATLFTTETPKLLCGLNSSAEWWVDNEWVFRLTIPLTCTAGKQQTKSYTCVSWWSVQEETTRKRTTAWLQTKWCNFTWVRLGPYWSYLQFESSTLCTSSVQHLKSLWIEVSAKWNVT